MILNKASILLVDDEPLVLEMFESVLVQEGYEVSVAPNAKDALNHLERSFFDVLVCDVKLEDFDGFDILNIARRKHPDMAVVLITGAPDVEDASRAENLGAAYLSKPIGFDLLTLTVNQSLAHARSNQKQRAQM